MRICGGDDKGAAVLRLPQWFWLLSLETRGSGKKQFPLSALMI